MPHIFGGARLLGRVRVQGAGRSPGAGSSGAARRQKGSPAIGADPRLLDPVVFRKGGRHRPRRGREAATPAGGHTDPSASPRPGARLPGPFQLLTRIRGVDVIAAGCPLGRAVQRVAKRVGQAARPPVRPELELRTGPHRRAERQAHGVRGRVVFRRRDLDGSPLARPADPAAKSPARRRACGRNSWSGGWRRSAASASLKWMVNPAILRREVWSDTRVTTGPTTSAATTGAARRARVRESWPGTP